MKNVVVSFFVLALLTISISCSKNESENDDITRDSKVINYLNMPNTDELLLSEVYIKEDKATTYFYGSTDSNGDINNINSIAFQELNSETVYYFLLDELSRVIEIYSTINGIKDTEVQSFIYSEDDVILYTVKERNWSNGNETIKHFSAVEVDGANFNVNNIFGKLQKIKGPTWSDIKAFVILATAVTVAAGVIAIGIKLKLYGLAIGAAITFAGAAIAEEPTQTPNPNAPSKPQTTVIVNQCTNSNLSVIIGVDPGNELYAIVNGDSTFYDFYWSTGEEDTDIITSHITAPDDGVYYVMVKDEKGCIAFASTSANENLLEIYKEAAIGNWTTTWHYDNNGNGVLDPAEEEYLNQQINKFVFYEGGTGKRTSSKGSGSTTFTSHEDSWGTDPYYDIVWSITKRTDGYYLSFYDKRWTTSKKGGLITKYPNMECTQGTGAGGPGFTVSVKD